MAELGTKRKQNIMVCLGVALACKKLRDQNPGAGGGCPNVEQAGFVNKPNPAANDQDGQHAPGTRPDQRRQPAKWPGL